MAYCHKLFNVHLAYFNMKFDDETSLIATKAEVRIYNGIASLIYLIRGLLENKISPETEGLGGDYGCYLSDGVTVVSVGRSFMCTVSVDDIVVRRVRVRYGGVCASDATKE